uniref:Calmodulin n=1 Tax=Guillardia theta TaxID=55529 RepID=A0A7S4KY48_GUITH
MPQQTVSNSAPLDPRYDCLPEGWERRVDPASGRNYYVDHRTKTSHWSIPSYLLTRTSASSQPPATSTLSRAPSYMRPAQTGAAGAGDVQPSAPPLEEELQSSSIAQSRIDMRRMYSLKNFCPANTPAAQQLALKFAECVVCFDDMHKEACSVFLKNSKRICPHFLHYRCACDVMNSSRGGKHCPVCRRSFDSVRQVPSIDEDPEGWFEAVDLSGEGTLNQREVLEVLKAQLPLDAQRLEEGLPELWRNWDRAGDGVISKEEFLASDGLLACIRRDFYRDVEREARIPDVRENKEEWFDYWDYDKSGTLEQEEIVRALIKTFRLSDDRSRIEQMRSVVSAVWGKTFKRADEKNDS